MKRELIAIVGGIVMGIAAFTPQYFKWYGLGLGASLLLGSLVAELWSQFRKSKLPETQQWLDFGDFVVSSGRMLITDGGDSKVTLTVSGSSSFNVRIFVVTGKYGAVNRAIRIVGDVTCSAQPQGRHTLLVDTGVLAFVDESLATESFDRLFKISGVYELLGSKDAPLVASWMKDDTGVVRGIVLQTGEGDGEYNVRVGRLPDGHIELKCDFSEETEEEEGPT